MTLGYKVVKKFSCVQKSKCCLDNSTFRKRQKERKNFSQMILRRLLLHGRAGQKSPKLFFRVFFRTASFFQVQEQESQRRPDPDPHLPPVPDRPVAAPQRLPLRPGSGSATLAGKSFLIPIGLIEPVSPLVLQLYMQVRGISYITLIMTNSILRRTIRYPFLHSFSPDLLDLK